MWLNIKKENQCIAVAKYSRGIIVDQNNEPITNVKIYEDPIESKMRSISNAQGEFEIPHGVCGEIALKLVTQNGKSIRENMIRIMCKKKTKGE